MVNGRQLTDKMLCSRGCRGLQASRLGLSSQVTLLGHLKGASQLVGLNINQERRRLGLEQGELRQKKRRAWGTVGNTCVCPSTAVLCPLQPSIDVRRRRPLDAVR